MHSGEVGDVRRSLWRRSWDDRGAEAVEFALVLPLVVVLVMGMVDFGVTYNRWITVTAVAREGARRAAVGPCSASDIRAIATQYGLDSSQLTVAQLSSVTDSSHDKYWIVTVDYPYQLTIPWWGSSSGQLSATAEMRDEQTP